MGNTIGSNFDVTAIVNELMKKESIPLNRLNDSEQREEIKLSIFGQLKNIIDGLKKNIDKVTEAFNVISYAASSDNSAVMTAKITSNSNVYPSTHNIVISKLAQAETLGSVQTFSTRADAMNQTGNLGFTVGTSTMTINVEASDSLDKIRDKINTASDNNGVTANIVASTNQSGNTEYSLVVSSNKTGLDNKVTISGSLSSTFDFTNQISIAQNAEFTFDGKNVVRAENNINDVMDGVSFTLLATGSTKLTISGNDSERNAAVLSAMKEMIANYNQVIGYIDQNAADRTLTDSTAKMIKLNLQETFSKVLTGTGKFTSLLEVGIKTAKSGETKTKSGNSYTSIGILEIDETKLSGVIASQTAALKTLLLDKTNGFVKVADGALDKITQLGGVIPSKTSMIQEQISNINRKINNEESRLEVIKKELTAKYAALGAIMDKFDNMSKFLDMQFNNMQSGSKK